MLISSFPGREICARKRGLRVFWGREIEKMRFARSDTAMMRNRCWIKTSVYVWIECFCVRSRRARLTSSFALGASCARIGFSFFSPPGGESVKGLLQGDLKATSSLFLSLSRRGNGFCLPSRANQHLEEDLLVVETILEFVSDLAHQTSL